MPSVKLKENEPFDVALRRFKRAAAVKRHAKKVQRESKKFTRLY